MIYFPFSVSRVGLLVYSGVSYNLQDFRSMGYDSNDLEFIDNWRKSLTFHKRSIK